MIPDVITQVAFATGRILHKGTGRPLDGEINITAREGPLASKILPDGTFALSGAPEILFPELSAQGYVLHLNIRAKSAQYRDGFIDLPFSLSVAQNSAFDPPPPAAPTALVDAGTIFLPADPVNVRGVVVEAANPSNPIPSAQVKITHGDAPLTASTDSQGRYRLDGVQVTAPSQLVNGVTVTSLPQVECSKANFKTETRNLMLDYGKLVQEENFRLPPS